MLVQEIDSGSRSEWDDYVRQHPASTCYHHRAWQKVAERAYRLPTHFLIARERAGGPVQGALPLFCLRGMVRTHLANGLFGAYASVLAETPAAHDALARRARTLAEELRVSYLLLKTLEEKPPLPTFQKLDSWVIATLPLQSDPEALWRGLRDKIRNCVRKAQRNGLTARWGAGELPHFYDVLSENMHRKGAPIYGYEFIRELAEAFGNDADVITLRLGERVVAGALVLRHRGTTYVPFASSRPAYLAMSPNNLLYWEIIRRSCELGMELLDFGRSLRDSGPLAFKLGWGARAQPQPCYVHSTRGLELHLNPGQGAVKWISEGWKQLPRGWTEALGPVICRQIAGLL
jgi:FemAB-related protein (PEP-CTERM system-associated)